MAVQASLQVLHKHLLLQVYLSQQLLRLKNRNGVKVHTGQTPATVSLKKVPVILNQKVIKYLSVNLVIKLKR